MMDSYRNYYAVSDGRVLTISAEGQASILGLADLHPLGQVILGAEIRDAIADPDHGRLYVNDSAGRLHVFDARNYRPLATLQVGSGALSFDAANGLLFVARARQSREVAVIDTATLTAAGVITGGDAVAVDPAGRRAFVGSEMDPQVQVWDTRTFNRLAAIPISGRPIYNPLRDELYLRNPAELSQRPL